MCWLVFGTQYQIMRHKIRHETKHLSVDGCINLLNTTTPLYVTSTARYLYTFWEITKNCFYCAANCYIIFLAQAWTMNRIFRFTYTEFRSTGSPL